MIDYLEALFVTADNGRPAGEEELPRVPVPAMGKEQEVPETGAAAMRGEEFWQVEAVRRLESALSEMPALRHRPDGEIPEEMGRPNREEMLPEGGHRESFASLRTGTVEGVETLEHRLRRDSRRYDSGFFWY